MSSEQHDCAHERAVWVESKWRVGLVCRDCHDCTYDGTWKEFVPTTQSTACPYPEGAALSPFAEQVGEVSWWDIFAVGLVNGTRDEFAWMAYVVAFGAGGYAR
jgi:hypothetical protein